MKIIAKRVKCKHLMPGDLFSMFPQAFWDGVISCADEDGNMPIGQKVYIRTDAPCPPEDRENEIYRIRITKK